MKKNLLLLLLALCSLNAVAADYYWVNGGGLWSDLGHWRLGSSGGSIPSIVPSSADNVFFTSASGFGTTVTDRTVILDANGFCNNMSWDAAVPNNPIFNRSSTTYKVEVWNNLTLAPTVNYQQSIVFKGTGTSSFTTNGTVDGIFAFEIDKPGGTLNLVDSFVCTSASALNNIALTNGTFDATGKTIKAYQFNSNNSNTRALNVTGSTLVFSYQWNYRGTNKVLNAAGSSLVGNSVLLIDGGTYNVVASNGLFDGDMSVANAIVSKLTYTNVSTGGFATVSSNNIIDTVIFKGRGRVYNTNTIGKLICERNASILGKNNTFGTILAQDIFAISVFPLDTNTIDSLLLAPNKTTTLSGTININKYMKAQGGTCDAFTEITAVDSARLFFATGAAALIDNVFLTNIKAFGPITPIAVSGVDGDNNTGFNITAPASLSGTTLYWVGGTGDWNDKMHWSYTSGGTGGACIPFIADTVVFNSGSGLGSGQIVTTSGNSYCYNMNWLSGVGTTTFNEAGPTALLIYGSLVLTPAVTMNATAEFTGTETTSTITTNGSTLGSLRFHTRKSGTGAVTLLDNWTNGSGIITLVSGSFNMPGRTISINRFTGNTNAVRSLDISNANITVANTWAYVGNNKSINSTGSYINAVYALNTDGLSYPRVDATYPGAGNPQAFTVNFTTFGALTFTGTNATSGINIDSSNTIRRLEFKGAGAIAAGGNVIDTLIFAASRNYQVTGTSTINNYFQATSPTCTGLLEIRGNTSGTFQFSGSTVINMANVYLQNMNATGVPPVTVSGADAGGNSGWNITYATGTPRYWIGGSGDWNDAAHWSLSSGGTGGACIPTVYDDVYFDANSGFTAGSKTVTVNNGNAYCRNLDWSAALNSPIWTKAAAWTIEVWGDSARLNPAATFTVSPLTFKGNSNAVLSGTVLGNFDIRVQKPGGSLRLLNNYSNILSDFLLNDGTLNVSGRTLSIGTISNEGLPNTMTMDISNATITLDTIWRYNGTVTAHTLNATGSSISTKTFQALGMTYNNVNVSGILNSNAVFSNTTINRLVFTNTTTSSMVGINGAGNTIGTADYKGGGGIYGTGNTIDTLIFFPGNTYTLTAGTNTTVTGAWYGSGTPCRLTEILSSSTSANATVTKTGGDVDFDYVRLRRITAAGAAIPFSARQHTIDMGGNTNWSIAPYDGASPIYGLGPDTALYASEFPHTLHTDGFFGSPSSLYTWNDASTADSLQITGVGTYSVRVNFVDGCTINDTIVVTLRTILPITLSGFTAQMQDCQAYLSWQTPSASDLSRFVIERSTDGREFTSLGTVTYTQAVKDYTYVDRSTESGLALYRLRLIHQDGSYEYSTAASVRSDCSRQVISVYPTHTNDLVFVQLPAAFETATIEVFSGTGQLLSLPGSGTVDNKQTHRISFKGLVQGTYLLQISHNGQIQTTKLFYQP